ncbi:MAG: carboxypeptidase regulatory-like domain-containing protein [Fibrobacteraceae bacterium]|nr:carboxypeptidase regulatory-like domain-containing protein [Fibrobacteraceae bacterium]
MSSKEVRKFPWDFAISFFSVGLFFCAAIALLFLSGCSESDTAGVITETESGQNAFIDEDNEKVVNVDNCSESIPSSLMKNGGNFPIETACINYDRNYALTDIKGTAVSEDGSVIKNAKVLLKRVVRQYDGLETSTRETTSDENGNFSFKDLVYKATYLNIPPDEHEYELDEKGRPVVYFDFTLQVESGESSEASYSALNLKESPIVTEGTNSYRKIDDAHLSKTSSREIRIEPHYQSGDYICLDYSFVCHTLTEEEISKGAFFMENIPEGVYQNVCSSTECTKMANPVVTRSSSEEIAIAFPEEARTLFDSTLKNTALNNVLALVSLEKHMANPILVNASSLSKLMANGNRYWASIDFNTLDTAKYNVVEGLNAGISSNIIMAKNSILDSVITRPHLLSDKTYRVGYSFKVKFDGSKEEKALSLLKSSEDSYFGFEIRQCEANSVSVCTRIRSGLDSVATDSTIYGKAEILDGEEHQFALVFAENHLTIAVDGKIIRDTDVKVVDDFSNYLTHVTTIGGVELKDFVLFTLDENIRISGEPSWNRLKAWLVAHQMLSR